MCGKINKIIFLFVFYIVHKNMIYGFVNLLFLFDLYFLVNIFYFIYIYAKFFFLVGNMEKMGLEVFKVFRAKTTSF